MDHEVDRSGHGSQQGGLAGAVGADQDHDTREPDIRPRTALAEAGQAGGRARDSEVEFYLVPNRLEVTYTKPVNHLRMMAKFCAKRNPFSHFSAI